VVRRIKPRAAAPEHLRRGKLRQDPARFDSPWRLGLITEDGDRAPIQRVGVLERDLDTVAQIRANGGARLQRHDRLAHGRVSAATLWGGSFLLVLQVLRLFVAGTAAWLTAAAWLTP
jgi:hypothetical protein